MSEIKVKVPFFKRWKVIKAVNEAERLTAMFADAAKRNPAVECRYCVYANTRTWELQVRLANYVPPTGMVEIYRSTGNE